jgi:hypothetical protein
VAQEGGGLEVTVSLPGADTTPVVAASATVRRPAVTSPVVKPGS